jgi:hypothetical protein
VAAVVAAAAARLSPNQSPNQSPSLNQSLNQSPNQKSQQAVVVVVVVAAVVVNRPAQVQALHRSNPLISHFQPKVMTECLRFQSLPQSPKDIHTLEKAVVIRGKKVTASAPLLRGEILPLLCIMLHSV